MSPPDGVEILGPAEPRFDEILTDEALAFVAGVHPRFDPAKAERLLAKTTIKRNSRVRELSKGMVTQLHLAIVMAIDAKLLILDEPTIGLDIVFRKQRIAVFIDGCYWHACPKHRTVARTNASYWSEKLARNVARDADTTSRLQDAGWTVLRFWEHEDPETVATAVAVAVRSQEPTEGSPR